jgi:type II secretory pathway pseudopilin PulG
MKPCRPNQQPYLPPMNKPLPFLSACDASVNALRGAWAGQGGAMFGMDARIALIVAAILTAAGGVTLMSRLEGSKVQAAEMQVEQLREALNRYYTQVGINQLPTTLEDMFRESTIADASLRRDPWGNPWEYSRATATVRIEDTPITMQLAVIYSRGKDGVAESGGVSSENDYNAWMTRGDDVGVKYISRDIEMRRLQEYRGRAQLIVDKLEAVESAAFLEAQNTCSTGAETIPTWCTSLEGKNYTLFNYYPMSDADDTSGVVYYADKVQNKRAYASGNLAEMQQMMIDLGLPAAYAQDPWGRVLMFNPNITQRTDPPFSASICFSNGENCLTR